MSATLFIYSVLNVLTFFLLGLILNNSSYSGIFSLTYPMQYIAHFTLAFFSSASNVRANKENNKNCVYTGMLLGICFGFLVFLILAIFIDNYITFMNLDASILKTFTLMSCGQMFFSLVNNFVC